MTRNIFWVVVGLVVAGAIAGALVFNKLMQFGAMGAAMAAMPEMVEHVNVYEVKEEEWHPRVSSVGSVFAKNGTIVSTEADGVVREIKFREGTEVTATAELIQLDTEIERAQLHEAEAAAELAAASYGRVKELGAAKTVAQQELDTNVGALKQAQAKVENLKAVIAKKTVRAPFSGKLGIRQISVGQFLEKGKPVVSLQALDPVYVDISLPQQRLGEITEGQKVEVTSDSYPGHKFEGTITAINPEIDARTRSMRVQATLRNPDGKLRPGMFVSTDVLLTRTEKVLFIPETAVQYAPYGDSVFVLEPKQTTGTATAKAPKPASAGTSETLSIRQEIVRLGARQGDFIVAVTGLKPGDKVVSTGVFKLRPAMSVVIDNSLAPKFKLDPQPANS